MATVREWLSTQIDPTTGIPLAKANSRGRFSRAAMAAVEKAIAEGMTFDEPETTAKSATPREKRVATSTPQPAKVKAPERDYDLKDVRQWAQSVGLTVSPRGRVSSEILSQYAANNPEKPKAVQTVSKPKEKVRQENVAWGLSKPDPEKPFLSITSIAFEKCYKCGDLIAYCKCADGPRCPKWLNGGEVASLTKP